jgi:hypothetical protein
LAWKRLIANLDRQANGVKRESSI